MEPENGLGLRIVETADAREGLHAWILVEAGDAHQAIASVEGEDELGERRRQGDDAVDLGGNRRAKVLPVDCDRRMCQRDGEDEDPRRHWTAVSLRETTSLVA